MFAFLKLESGKWLKTQELEASGKRRCRNQLGWKQDVSFDLELIGKDIKKLRTIINQLETARNKEKENEAENVDEQSIIDSLFGEDEDKSNTVSNDAFVKKSVVKNDVDNKTTNEVVNEVTNKTN